MHHWLPDVVGMLQVAVGGMLTGELDHMREAIEETVRAIPRPRTPVERVLLRGLLLDLGLLCAQRTQATLRRSADTQQVVAARDLFNLHGVVSEDDPLPSFLEWVRRFFREAERRYARPAAKHAAAIVATDFRERFELAAVARQVHVTPSQLHRQFRREFGLSLRDYHSGTRVLASLDQVLGAKSDVLAREIGYKSRKNFYRRFRQWTGLTPTAFRQLPTERRQQITDQLRRSLKLDRTF